MDDTSNGQNANCDIDTNLHSLVSKEERLDWDSYFISIALLAAKRSSCNRLHVGCIIVKNNRILSTGYNGFLKGAPHISRVVNNHEQFTVHAEQNAICDSANRGISLADSYAYVTHYPCLTCFKLLLAAGITEVKYLIDYKNNPLNLEMALENNIKLIKLNI
jgi:dCMP deaminase|tara:strand:- start:1139 stop:1624 length:486 start_codon:yes stop_codon:yes gene_type:complete